MQSKKIIFSMPWLLSIRIPLGAIETSLEKLSMEFQDKVQLKNNYHYSILGKENVELDLYYDNITQEQVEKLFEVIDSNCKAYCIEKTGRPPG